MSDEDLQPFHLMQHNDGSASLMLTDFDEGADIFEEFGLDAGGYAWHGVADALVRNRAKHLRRKLQYDPEASMFVAYSKDGAALRELAALLRQALREPALLREAIEAADPDLMD
ncbi:MAG: Imm51 family immunity protein [Gemmataceae bacterium]